MEEPSFWEDAERSTKIVKEAKNLKDTVEGYKHLEDLYEEIELMIEMGYEENDPEVIPEIQTMLDELSQKLEAMRLSTLLTGEYDKCNAILRLNAGAGGTESCDWCSMLYRMYCRWAEAKGYSVEVLDFLDGDEAGIKSVTIQINGENAFGYLKSERGVHRLVRISPFNAAGKRQTSFVSCDVMPDIEEDLDVEINPDDLRIDTYRSSGAGGQHINKTSSAIRITHIYTGTANGFMMSGTNLGFGISYRKALGCQMCIRDSLCTESNSSDWFPRHQCRTTDRSFRYGRRLQHFVPAVG